MAFTGSEITTILLKADRAIHKLGTISESRRFNENDLSLYSDRILIYLLKKAVEFGYAAELGTTDYDKLAGYLLSRCTLYDLGNLAPIYSGTTLSYQVLGTIDYITLPEAPTLVQADNIANTTYVLKVKDNNGQYHYVQTVVLL